MALTGHVISRQLVKKWNVNDTAAVKFKSTIKRFSHEKTPIDHRNFNFYAICVHS